MADDAESAAAPGNTGGGGSRLMVVLTGLNTLLLAGVIALVLLRTGAHAATRPTSEAEQAPFQESHGDGEKKDESTAGGDAAKSEKGDAGPHSAAMLQLPDFVVHLRDPDTDHYARLTLNVELRSEKDKDAVNGRMPQVRDAFLAYLSDRSVEELRGSDGMALVKQDLAKKLNEIVPAAPVKALYVTDIVVQ